jgi:murein DD-endopeptidase MepM/ murein hydrolase activator NlpD
MTRLLALAAALLLLGGSSAAAADGPVFSVVGSGPALPSAEVPNAPGSIALPPDFTTQPFFTRTMLFDELNALWHRAGTAYGIPWEVLAAINKIESNFGKNMGPSSAGAVGWMQFMPDTWLRWGMDANADGISDPWDPEDAVHAAARYLAAAGAREDLYRGVFAYNHADWYVRDVLDLAAVYRGGGPVTFSLDRLQVQLEQAREAVVAANTALEQAVRAARAAQRSERRIARRVARTIMVSDRLALEQQAFEVGARAEEAATLVDELRAALDEARFALDAARSGATMAPAAGVLLGSPVISSGYAFPVGGGPQSISVGRDHHDYPAADIAAPQGAPLYALTDGFVEDAWPTGAGNCGIGFKLVATLDGRSWTYCHLSYLEPGVVPGAALATGQPVGLVGSTGNSTGPHLHLQLGPELGYPQEEPWFQGFAGSAFTWQDAAVGPHDEIWAVAAVTKPVFQVVEEEPVFEVVDDEPADVVGFALNS